MKVETEKLKRKGRDGGNEGADNRRGRETERVKQMKGKGMEKGETRG